MSGEAISLRDLRHETRAAIAAVREALVLVGTHAGSAATYKGRLDAVTRADIAVEDAVRDLLTSHLDIPVVGEELGGDDAESAYWLVDPICGTRNFASGVPLCCTNVALVERGAVTVAVVGDAARGEVTVAERGVGAYALDGDGLRAISPSAESRTVVIEDSHASGPGREQAARFFAALVRAHSWELRSLSTTLVLPYVAAGRFAAYVLFWTSAVHAAAGSLLVAEAGGEVSELDGSAWSVQSASLVAAADAALHEDIIGLLQECGTTVAP